MPSRGWVVLVCCCIACFSFLLIHRPSRYNGNPRFRIQNEGAKAGASANRMTDIQHHMVLTTAADSTYFRGLKNLIGSIHYWEPNRTVGVFNLGMTKEQLKEVRSWRNVELHWINGIPDHYPAHVFSLKEYAWKPLVLNASVNLYNTFLYLDAGCDIRGPLDPIEDILKEEGHFHVKGQDLDMTRTSHQGIYDYFNTSKLQMRKKPHFAGGIQGYVQESEFTKKVLPRLLACALKTECISPPGSSDVNHRYDQSVLSLIVYLAQPHAKAHTEYLAAHRKQLSADPTKPSKMVIYTARQKSQDYLSLLLFGRCKSCPKQTRNKFQFFD